MRARKHIQKLNNEGLNGLLGTSLKAVETLERVIKKELERERKLQKQFMERGKSNA